MKERSKRNKEKEKNIWKIPLIHVKHIYSLRNNNDISSWAFTVFAKTKTCYIFFWIFFQALLKYSKWIFTLPLIFQLWTSQLRQEKKKKKKMMKLTSSNEWDWVFFLFMFSLSVVVDVEYEWSAYYEIRKTFVSLTNS